MKNGKLNSPIHRLTRFLFFFLLVCVANAFALTDGGTLEFGGGLIYSKSKKDYPFLSRFGMELYLPFVFVGQYGSMGGNQNIGGFVQMRRIVSPVFGLGRELETKRTYATLGLVEKYPYLSRLFFWSEQSVQIPLNRGEDLRGSVVFGVGVRLFAFDDDHDGVVNKKDLCPRTPAKVRVDSRGCPLDTDGDGVFDGLDKCPGTPFAALVDSFGCPTDSDSDGVFDGVDRCPGTPHFVDVDSVGCPIDSDKDGVPDYADSCANTPEGAYVDISGCPKDSDFDGVPDGIDECPFTPTGFEVNSFGCPHYLPISFEIVYDPVDEFGNLRQSVLKRLDMLALRIRAYPTRVIELGGYTDSEGSIPYNIGRAKIMVNKVKDYLVSKGVSPESLQLAYYGKKNFIADNTTPQGRAKNRRVEFKFLYDKASEASTKESR